MRGRGAANNSRPGGFPDRGRRVFWCIAPAADSLFIKDAADAATWSIIHPSYVPIGWVTRIGLYVFTAVYVLTLGRVGWAAAARLEVNSGILQVIVVPAQIDSPTATHTPRTTLIRR